MRSNFIYKHFSPKEFNEQKPAIFLFHGYGSDEEDLLPLVEDLTETHHIFSLRGSITLPSGYAYWYIEEDDTNIAAEFNDAIQSVQNFIKQAIKEYNLDSQNVVLLGFSQGAMLVQSIALIMGKDINKVVGAGGQDRSSNSKAVAPGKTGDQDDGENVDDNSVGLRDADSPESPSHRGGSGQSGAND